MTTDTAVRSELSFSSPAVTRVVSYLRVSTGRQAESDLSIPDQRRQIERYCAARGWTIVEDYVEPGSSATDDRRPAFQQMIDAALVRPPAFSTILVHSFSRFFRDQFQFERYVRKFAKNGVQVISITQDLGDKQSARDHTANQTELDPVPCGKLRPLSKHRESALNDRDGGA